jgi:predicted ATPase
MTDFDSAAAPASQPSADAAAPATMAGWQEEWLALREKQKEGWRVKHDAQVRSGALRKMVGEAKARELMQPEIMELLEELQDLEHQRSVGVYEKLLTAILADALPGERRAVLELGSERGLPALKIELEKAGQRESILHGSGGAVTNIVCAGLRLIALARSKNRRFIVLDEPDCWLKPSRVPKFASILGQIAQSIGTQAFLISHHDPHFFAGVAHILRLERHNGKIEALDASGPAPHWPDASTPGIRWVRLINFMSHEDTTLRLAPGITCLTGENDIGKSACVAALRALFYGDTSDSFIRHGADSFAVEAELENGVRVMLRHFEKKSPKRLFELREPGQEPMRSTPKSGVPDWMERVGGVSLLDGLDAQLSNQKDPVFLLRETAQKRAAILAIGREAGHLQSMIALNKKKAAEDKALARDGERELFELSRVIDASGPVELWPEASRKLRADGFALEEELRVVFAAREKFAAAKRAFARKAVCDAAAGSMPASLPAAPSLEATDAWRSSWRGARRALAGKSIVLPADLPQSPWIEPTALLRETLSRAKRASASMAVQLPADLPQAPRVEPTAAQRETLSRARRARAGKEGAIPSTLPETPELLSSERWRGLARRARQARAASAGVQLRPLPQTPRIEPTERARERLLAAARLLRVARAAEGLPRTPTPPELAPTAQGRDLLARARAALAASAAAKARIEEVSGQVADFERRWGRSCPTCGQAADWGKILLGQPGESGHDAHAHGDEGRPLRAPAGSAPSASA